MSTVSPIAEKSRRLEGKPNVPTIHFCHADDCVVEIAKDVYFCDTCRDRLPPKMRKDVHKLCVSGQHWSELKGESWSALVKMAMKWLKENRLPA